MRTGMNRRQYSPWHSTRLRGRYIHELVSYCTENGIDGVDLDWEGYPQSIDDDDHLALVNQMSDSLRSSALSFSVALMLSQYDLCSRMIGSVDHFNIMGYETFDENGDHVPFEMLEWYLNKYLSAGVPASKIVMGVPCFARRQYIEGDTSPLYLTYRQIVNLISTSPVS
ncbi:MAG: glycoside hydrolase family 18 protein [Bacteroidales bacterium]